MEELAQKLQNLKCSIECPVCFIMPESKPIYQCKNGHVLCKSCHQSLETCPKCHRALDGFRNLTAESFLEAFSKPCRFAGHGCKAKIFEDHEKDHEKKCGYRQVRCPHQKCSIFVAIQDVKDHLKEMHGLLFSPTKNLWWNVPGAISMKEDNVNCISYENFDFIKVQKKSADGLWHFWIYGIGTPKDLACFKCSILTKNTRHYSQTSGPVISLDKSPEDVMTDADGLFMCEKFLASLMKKGQVEIFHRIWKRKDIFN